MSVYSFKDLIQHYGHHIDIVTHGPENENPADVAIVCLDCQEILLCYDNVEELPTTCSIDKDTAVEFALAVIDEIEGLLEDKGIVIPNNEKSDNPDAANVYGSDYYSLEDSILELMGYILKIKIEE